MTPQPSRNHVYEVSFYDVPTAEQVEEEIGRARAVFGTGMKMRMTSHDDQRDGYSVSIKFTEPDRTRSFGGQVVRTTSSFDNG